MTGSKERQMGIYFSQEERKIIVPDTGASMSVSHKRSDFVSWKENSHLPTLQGITGKATVCGKGRVR